MARHMACMHSMKQAATPVNLYKINHRLKAKA
jgi:hypothetical protein